MLTSHPCCILTFSSSLDHPCTLLYPARTKSINHPSEHLRLGGARIYETFGCERTLIPAHVVGTHAQSDLREITKVQGDAVVRCGAHGHFICSERIYTPF